MGAPARPFSHLAARLAAESSDPNDRAAPDKCESGTAASAANNAHYSGISALRSLKIGRSARRAYEPNLAQRRFRQIATTAITNQRETPGAA
jgi:hypothetical protein